MISSNDAVLNPDRIEDAEQLAAARRANAQITGQLRRELIALQSKVAELTEKNLALEATQKKQAELIAKLEAAVERKVRVSRVPANAGKSPKPGSISMKQAGQLVKLAVVTTKKAKA